MAPDVPHYGSNVAPASLLASPPTMRTALWYSVANLGAGLFYGFNNATLPLILSQFTQNPFIIGLLSSTRSIEGTVVQPVVGAWSDRTWTRWGRRRPFMLVGIPLSALFLVASAHAPSLPVLVATVFLFSLMFNIAVDPLNALLADLFPPQRRSAVNGLATVAQLVGTIALLLAAAQLAARHLLSIAFYLVGAGLFVTFAITIAALREPRLLAHDGNMAPHHPDIRAYAAHLLRHRTALRFLLCLFCYNFGVNAILPYLSIFAIKVIGTDDATAQYLFLALVLSTGVAVLPAGLLAGRIGKGPVLGGGLGLMAVAAVAGLFVQSVPQTLVVILFAGLANGAITATNWPLLTDLVPPDEVGVFAGLKTAFESVALPVSVLLSSTLIDRWSYRAIFVVLSIGAVAAIVLLRTVRTGPMPQGVISATRW